MSETSGLSDPASKLLWHIGYMWPEPLLVAPETDDLMALRELDYIEQWDSYPNGDRRWMITHEGREFLKMNYSVREPSS